MRPLVRLVAYSSSTCICYDHTFCVVAGARPVCRRAVTEEVQAPGRESFNADGWIFRMPSMILGAAGVAAQAVLGRPNGHMCCFPTPARRTSDKSPKSQLCERRGETKSYSVHLCSAPNVPRGRLGWQSAVETQTMKVWYFACG